MRKKSLALLLITLLTLSSFSQIACGEDTVKRVKQKVTDLAIYTDAGLQLADDFEREKVLSPEQAGVARAALEQVKGALQVFIDRAKGYTKFDAGSKAELAGLFADVAAGVREVMTKAKPLIVAAIGALGVAHAERLLSKANTLLVAMETSARLIESRLGN